MASQQQTVLIFQKQQRHASNSSSRQRSSNSCGSGSQPQKDVKFTINSRQQIDHQAHKQVRSNQGVNSRHQYQQSAQLTSNSSGKGDAAMFNPAQLLQSSQESVRKPASMNLGNYKEITTTTTQQQARRHQQQKNAVGHGGNIGGADQQQFSTNQQLQFSQQQSQGIGRNVGQDSNMAVSSHKVQYRSKFQGSFLASHNNKSKTAATTAAATTTGENSQRRNGPGKYSVSPHGNGPSQKLKPTQMQPSHVKPTNKSPAVIANPSIFTMTATTANNGGTGMVSPNNQGSSGSHAQRYSGGAGSNPSSVRHNSTKQSDILLATEHSTIKQRENIKVFSFKPGNLKVQPKTLNVHQIKPSQVTLNKDQKVQMNNAFKKGVAATSQPSPTNLAPNNHQTTKQRNRSSGSSGAKKHSLMAASSNRQKYPSPEANISNESRQQVIVMQPNIVKKPLMTNYSLEENNQRDISPDPSNNRNISSMRSKKKIVTQPTVLSQQSAKRVKSASRHSTGTGGAATTLNGQAEYGGGTVKPSTGTKLKVKKRGHSETAETNQSIIVNREQHPQQHQPTTLRKQLAKGDNNNNNFQQRGNSLQPPQTMVDNVSHKLAALKQQQDAAEEMRNLQQQAQAGDHKEVIVNHIRKYIKLKPSNEASTSLINGVPQEKTELIIQNLRDFLVYLENKNIINPKKLSDQNEMKNLIKDIMKLDLTKFSKPRSSSQPREPKHHSKQVSTGTDQVVKKRKVMPSPNCGHHIEAKTVPTQISAATQSSQQSISNFAKMQHSVKKVIAQESLRMKTASVETSPLRQIYDYASMPKYMKYTTNQKGIKTTGHRSRDNSGSDRTNSCQHQPSETTTHINMSQVNFVLPSNRQDSKRSSNHQDNRMKPIGDVYGGAKSLQQSLLQSSQGSPDSQAQNYQRDSKHPYQSTKYSEKSLHAEQMPQRSSLKQTGIKIQSKESTLMVKKKRLSTSKGSVEQEGEINLQQAQFKYVPKVRVSSNRGAKTSVPSTQQSPRNNLQQRLVGGGGVGSNGGVISHQKVSSQPNLGTNNDPQSALQQQQQQVPTIQLMINTNGQGKFLGINVNNYCFAPQTNGQQLLHPQANGQQQLQQQQQDDQQRQLNQLLQMQNQSNTNSAEQLQRLQNPKLVQKGGGGYRQEVRTEPDDHHSQGDPSPTKVKFQHAQQQNILQEFIRQQKNKNQMSVNSGQQRLDSGSCLGSQEFQIAPSPEPPQMMPESSKNPKYLDQSRIYHSKGGMMIIQDDDDENTGGDGAEAKMSPTSSGHAHNFQQTSGKPGHHETPQMNKLQTSKQQSSSNRGGSNRSSQRNSSITKALQDLNKSQIQAQFSVSNKKFVHQDNRDSRSKESSRERSLGSGGVEKLMQPGSASGGVSISNRPQSTTATKVSNTCAAPSAMNSPSNSKPGRGSSSKVVLNDEVTRDREKLIQYVKAYVAKHNKVPHTTLDFYKCVKLLGKGAFGKITLGIHKLTGKYVAIKSIDKVNIKDEYSRRKVFQEVYILKKIRHSCVIRLLEVFESEKHFLMVMEYSGGGDLLQYVKKRKRLNEQSAKAIFKQILYALGHCHCRSVLHRDIKLDNVLMDGEGGVKLCDFGVSRLVKKGQTINEQCGTPAYLAPEIIIDKGYQGFSADIWSLGVLLYAMVQGTVPFKAHNISDLHKLILKGEFEFPVDTVSDDVKDLVKKMIVLDPTQRISIPQMLNHPWVFDIQRDIGEPGNLDDDEHDLRVGSTFFREEVLGGLITGYKCDGSENGNINFVNVENLYYRGGQPQKEPTTDPSEKVTYSDYCALTEDFMTYRIDEEAIEVVTGFGYSREMVIQSINRGDVNHATAAYYLLVY